MKPVTDAEIVAELLALAADRAPRSFCPSEVARRLASDWRPLMPDVRRLGATLPLLATQRGKPVDISRAKGPIRLTQNV